MNQKQIDIILEIADTLNFNKAARNLYITQPALSYQVKTLEEEVGFKIFDRDNGVTITPAGERFCCRLKDISNEIKMAVEEGKLYSAIKEGNIVEFTCALKKFPACSCQER